MFPRLSIYPIPCCISVFLTHHLARFLKSTPVPSSSRSFIQQICMEVGGTVMSAGDGAVKMINMAIAFMELSLEGNMDTQPLNSR